MEPKQNNKNIKVPDDMERAIFWADLLSKAKGSRDIYIMAKSNLDTNNKNAITNNKARKILEAAISEFEETWER